MTPRLTGAWDVTNFSEPFGSDDSSETCGFNQKNLSV